MTGQLVSLLISVLCNQLLLSGTENAFTFLLFLLRKLLHVCIWPKFLKTAMDF